MRAKKRENSKVSSGNELFKAALKVRENAYAPYSSFKVGASLRLKDRGELVGACNVENASLGGTICAERAAIVQAVARFGGEIEIEEVCVVVDASELSGPCGLCRQALAEFMPDEGRIFLANTDSVQSSHRFGDLFPMAFRSFKSPQK